jgi:hypothetical protein
MERIERLHGDHEESAVTNGRLDASHTRLETSQEASLKRPLPRNRRDPLIVAWRGMTLAYVVPCARHSIPTYM